MSYRSALQSREFRGIFVAQVATQWGDQLTRLALAFIVYNESGSAFVATLAFAVTYLPDFFGGPLLAAMADRHPRREVMLVCDLARAVLAAAMALPGVPVGVLLVVLLCSTLFTSPFVAARSALLPQVVPAKDYLSAISLSRLFDQVNQALGLLFGAVLLGVLHPRGALLADAATYLLSFVVLVATVRRRPAPRAVIAPGVRGVLADVRDGVRAILAEPVARSIVALAWTGGLCTIVAEGAALPYARDSGYGATATALLLAAIPAGFTIGLLLLEWMSPGPGQFRLLLRLEVLAYVPLLFCALHPSVPVVIVLWTLSGICQANLVGMIGAFNLALPDEVRGRANGVVAAGLGLAQTLAIVIGGALSVLIDPAAAVAGGAVVGLGIMAVLAPSWPHARLAGLAEQAEAEAKAEAEAGAGALPDHHLPPGPSETSDSGAMIR